MKVYLLATIGTDGVVRPAGRGTFGQQPFATADLGRAKAERTTRLKYNGNTTQYVIFECDLNAGTMTKIIG